MRRHPLNDLFIEEVVTVPDPDGSFTVDASIDAAEPALALWLGADGDDTGSEFTVHVERIEFALRDDRGPSGLSTNRRVRIADRTEFTRSCQHRLNPG